ncbi:SufS family cysteine desulfurase [Aquincola tertiaricarbonis]|uniref:cysteine desulfurase n=1 Tax=Aquincola tertiaricarbonis TaxID=391953 RepID=A0ABY4S342_AQUTE|nr:family 2A encapsulin nanocompartment cargo protein cysteine desulfurase [Aquincola tertiaricarbonis]URI06123.1 SufS family cysteine desulfurase [Aquincola tertiaricarbonis]
MSVDTLLDNVAHPVPPPGLPDAATLARLAGEFFAALPGGAPSLPASLPAAPVLGAVASPVGQANPAVGGVPVPANVQPAGLALPPGSHGPATPSLQPLGATAPGANLVPSSPQAPANVAAQAPSLLPHAQAPNGVPDHALVAAPAYDGRAGSQLLGVPQLPQVPALPLPGHPGHGGLPGAGVPAPAGATGYYFIDGPGTRAPAAAAPATPAATPAFDVNAVRRDFPILQERVNGKQLVWFDNAATTHKPQAVIDRLAYFYAHENSNIHRAAHTLAARATDAYEGARETVRRFIGAGSVDEVIFVRGTTEGINLIAKSWGAKHIGAGDEIIVSHLEHHANIVPWQQLAAEKGAVIRVIPVDDDGQVILSEYAKLLGPRTKLVSCTQVSNALGTVTPVQQIVAMAHAAGARALVDGAQSVSHMRVDVRALDADFFVFSGHKIFGPTGIGAVYGKREVLEDMPPWQGGGNMIADVTFERTVYHGPPTRFEAGTGNIADAVGLGAALQYVERIGIEAIGAYEHALLDYATHHIRPIPGVRLVGTAAHKASVLSFVLAGYSTEEVGQALNQEGIAVRTGHHCAQPILRRFGLETTVRPSLAFYNTCEEVDRMVAVVQQLAHRRRR